METFLFPTDEINRKRATQRSSASLSLPSGIQEHCFNCSSIEKLEKFASLFFYVRYTVHRDINMLNGIQTNNLYCPVALSFKNFRVYCWVGLINFYSKEVNPLGFESKN